MLTSLGNNNALLIILDIGNTQLNQIPSHLRQRRLAPLSLLPLSPLFAVPISIPIAARPPPPHTQAAWVHLSHPAERGRETMINILLIYI